MTGGNCDREGNTDGEYLSQSETFDSDEEDNPRQPKRIRKRAATLKDPKSTGRKEAARLYPLNRERDCEWAHLSQAGGGKHPIKGCAVRFGQAKKQEHRHHGPDKNTMNNEKGNVHRICTFCHNLWHAANDEDYDPDSVKED